VRIVLDTNVLVSGIFWTGIPFKILEHWIKGRFKLLITEDILKEYVHKEDLNPQ
jgi:predicted nucleic acid-binding protein